MPDERIITQYVDRVVDVIVEQTRQIARLAYATEQNFLFRLSRAATSAHKPPCEACGCRLISEQHDKCPACLTPTREDG